MSVNKNHIHKFRRRNYKTGNSVYFCTDNCDYKIGVEFSLGKVTRCNKCNNPFTMNEYSIRAAKPICMNCVKRKGLPNSNGDTNENTNQVSITDEVSKIAAENSISSLKNQMDSLITEKPNLLVKEYNPEDEDTIL